jgi:hypothetical protein
MRTIAIVLVAAFTLASCNFTYKMEKDDKGRIYRETSESGPGRNLKIEMTGEIYFNNNKTQITEISEDGYVEYRKGKVHIDIEPGDSKRAIVTITENGKTIAADSEKGMELLTEAIGHIAEMLDKG